MLATLPANTSDELTYCSGRTGRQLWPYQDEGRSSLWEPFGQLFVLTWPQTLAVLNPFGRMNQDIMDDSDVAGPIIFFLVFGTSLLVRRRLQRLYWEKC
jgi:hypothetical protein